MTFMRRSLVAVVCSLLLGAVTSPVRALNIQFRDITPGGMSPAEFLALQTGAKLWTDVLSDPVTVYIDVKNGPLVAGFIGSTRSFQGSLSYGGLRNLLVGDATTSADIVATSHLQAGPNLSFRANNLDGSWRFDNDVNTCPAGPSQPCVNNNRSIVVTAANAKALGVATGTSVTTPDATITFSDFYASVGYFDFDRSDGISPGTVDFAALAAHEIAHALGFGSGVALVESHARSFQNGNPNGYDNQFRDEKFATYTPLDLFRYSAADGVMDVRYGVPSYFSIDGGVTDIEDFSPGVGAIGYGADHFFPYRLNLMNPGIYEELAYGPSRADILALDVIGWNAVPEPGSLALLALGLTAGVLVRMGRATGAPGKKR